MITFAIGSYQIMDFVGLHNNPVYLYMRDDSNSYRGYIDFREEFAGPPVSVHSNGIINAHMPLKKLHYILDILRNEKPVYFSVDKKGSWAAIKTGLEPTGEEEMP
jgi:hypothetical protein